MPTLSLVFPALCALWASASARPSVLTPFGYRPADCVHGVDEGSIITNFEDHFVVSHPSRRGEERRIERCAPHDIADFQRLGVDGDGWQVYTKQNAGDGVSALLGQWPVPVNPARKSSQTLFTFTGLQNIDWVPPEKEPTDPFDIIQPVLQYGRSAAGGGDYWTVASWYVTLTFDVVYSRLQTVSVGDNIFGNMTKTGDEEWYINALDTDSGVNSDLTIRRSLLQAQPWIYVTLEVYSVYNCDEYPAVGTEMPYTQLQLFVDGSEQDAEWEVGTDGQSPPICGAEIAIVDANDVTITW